MTFVVVLMLTFMDGTFLQEKNVWANTEQECSQMIETWTGVVRENIKLWRKEPSTFITGCVKQ